MNKINPKKLLGSKWTAVTPINREKHFIVTEVECDEEDTVIACCIEAVMSKRSMIIDWHDLKDEGQWAHGW
ncbi:TIGR02450 family Trp-rich protein [Halieaceae bacterium IMCC14734]|uniref:TIGR02450 family Trp-rich protein n=1 Tax=Candidatus Litorirhabdus singularis TaxID=2518993 RepID=A0ABT3TLF1_9GAMM|nr:TIGR02450 family Trp-rich protein [Candidatus Litorirhabdus singularis]MCX2983148.1 TIGR02450 family Trp-rich protein [Candidatus Litorirhabdus singularis]